MVSTPQPLRAIEILRVDVWTADLPHLKTHHDSFETDIRSLLERGQRNTLAYGEQTATVLHELTAPHWKYFFSEIRRVISEVVQKSGAQLDEGVVHLRSWASILRSDADYSERYLRLSALHNHAPAFLSAVYYVRVPEEFTGGDGGTFFLNPLQNPFSGSRPGIVVPAIEGRIVLFPSWLMHGPAVLDFHQPRAARIVIAVDAHLIPK